MNELYLEFLDEPIEDGFRRRKPNSYLDFDYNSEMYLEREKIVWEDMIMKKCMAETQELLVSET